MGRVEEYREKIRQILTRHAGYNTIPRGLDAQIITDTEHDHYLFIRTGWYEVERRSYGCVMHMDIINEKIWVQYDGTEEGVANELADLGVPKEDIVLAYHEPNSRKWTDFGLG